MRELCVWLIWLLVPITCAATQSSSSELQQKADAASGLECSRLSMQAARQLVEDASRLFGAGNIKAAHVAIDGSLRYARRSVDCSLQAHKGEKAAEIDLRKLTRRMKEVLQAVDSEDRPFLLLAFDELEHQRDRLLHSMFGAAAGRVPEKKS